MYQQIVGVWQWKFQAIKRRKTRFGNTSSVHTIVIAGRVVHVITYTHEHFDSGNFCFHYRSTRPKIFLTQFSSFLFLTSYIWFKIIQNYCHKRVQFTWSSWRIHWKVLMYLSASWHVYILAFCKRAPVTHPNVIFLSKYFTNVSDRVEHNDEERGKSWLQAFSVFPECFKELSSSRSLKVEIMCCFADQLCVKTNIRKKALKKTLEK